MKLKEQQEARRLRSEEGLALNEIADRLQVSKSSVSFWVRDVVLSEEQAAQLASQNPLLNRQFRSSQVSRERARAARAACQEEGRERARQADPLHAAGCMLYWAEGSKSRCTVAFTNSDPDMVDLFVRFLERCYDVPRQRMVAYVNCHDDCASVTEIEQFWLERLQFDRSQLRKTTVNYHSSYSKRKRCGKLVYGTCRVSFESYRVVQSIYGAIQEYAGLPGNRWID